MSGATTSSNPTSSPSRGTRRQSPPLQQGDRLTHAEFMARYEEMPEHIKIERIEGIVYMPAEKVSAVFHGEPRLNMATWLGTYEALTPSVAAADNSTIFLDADNDPQPDLCLYIVPERGGAVKIDSKGYIVGSPEMIVEIAASSVSFDLGAKLNVYRRNGVREYVVHRTYDGEIDWFILRDGQYEKQSPDAQGAYRSQTFPGLWLNAGAIIDGNLAAVLATLRQGLASPEHADFVK